MTRAAKKKFGDASLSVSLPMDHVSSSKYTKSKPTNGASSEARNHLFVIKFLENIFGIQVFRGSEVD